MQGRYQYRNRIYSESNDTSPQRHTSRPNNHIRYIGKFPLAMPLPTYDVIIRKQMSREASEASSSKGRQSSTDIKRPNPHPPVQNYNIDSAQVTVELQRPDKVSIDGKKNRFQHKLIEKNFLPGIEKGTVVFDEQGGKRGLAKEGYSAGNSKMLEKVHKLFQILKPEVELPRNQVQANTSSHSKYRRACFFDNQQLPQPPQTFQPITTVNRVQQIRSIQNTVDLTANRPAQQIRKTEPVPVASLDPLEYPSFNMASYCRKPLTHQDRKRHKTIESKQSQPIQLFTFYPSKKRIQTQVVIDNEFL